MGLLRWDTEFIIFLHLLFLEVAGVGVRDSVFETDKVREVILKATTFNFGPGFSPFIFVLAREVVVDP